MSPLGIDPRSRGQGVPLVAAAVVPAAPGRTALGAGFLALSDLEVHRLSEGTVARARLCVKNRASSASNVLVGGPATPAFELIPGSSYTFMDVAPCDVYVVVAGTNVAYGGPYQSPTEDDWDNYAYVDYVQDGNRVV